MVSSVVTLGATLLYQQYYGQTLEPPAVAKKDGRKEVKKDFPKELIDEQLARNRAFLGDKAIEKIRGSFVIVVGAGGVGSYVAMMLARSGVGKIRIIDFDQVTLSSLNRHACATHKDVGRPKVNCIADMCYEIAPFVEVEPVVALWNKGQAEPLLEGNPTFVVDCIDNIDTKVDLLEYCYSVLNVPVISSMGAGTKADPTRVRIADISQSNEDPLSRSVRRLLRIRGISTGIPVIFSTEKPGKDKAKLLSLDDSEVDKGNVNELAVLQDFRVRILPVLGPMPGIFGLTIAAHILNWLGDYNPVFDPLQGGYSMAGKLRTKVYESALHQLVGQFARLKMPETRSVPISVQDAEYIIEEVHRGKSVITGDYNRLVLSVWDPALPVTPSNVVPMTKDQQSYHENEVLRPGKKPEDVYFKEVLDIAKARLEEDKWYKQFR